MAFSNVAAASLAIPIMLKQSTRLEVISNSTTASRSPNAATASSPGFTSLLSSKCKYRLLVPLDTYRECFLILQ